MFLYIDGNSRYVILTANKHLITDINHASSTLDLLNGMIRNCKEGHVCSLDVSREDINALEQINLDLNGLHQKWQSIFMWQDGPLIKAMRDGDLFLVDEISLADDSVLERLNSVLEPERMLVSFLSFRPSFITHEIMKSILLFPSVFL